MTEITSLIPHRPPMQWLTALTNLEEKSAVATATFAAADYPMEQGRLLETALVECMAQTVAAALGQRLQSGHTVERSSVVAMLVGVSGFKIHTRPAGGETLKIEVREKRRMGPIMMIAGLITSNGQLVAEGDLTVYS